MGRIRARIFGAREVAARWDRAATQFGPTMQRTLGELGDDASLAFAAHALRRSGRLARGIRAIPFGGGVIVRADARDPQTGFDYVAVTRFGHRVAFIRPKANRNQASVIATGRARQRGSRAALAFTVGGRLLFRPYVRGFHPAGDWAEKAMPTVDRLVEGAETRLGRKIEMMLG